MNSRYLFITALSFLAVFALTLSGGSQVLAQATDVTPAEAKEMLDSNTSVLVIDVSPMWASGHIPGARNYPVGDGSLDAALPKLDPDAAYLLYCHSDEASNAGTQKLVNAGFTNVKRLQGNFGAWSAEGFDVATPSYTDISASEALSLIEGGSGLTVIDVSGAFADGHLPGAVNYPLSTTLPIVIPNLDRNDNYLVYCHSDGASQAGAQALVDAGFTQVHRLSGNYSAWIGSGYMTERSTLSYSDLVVAEVFTMTNMSPDISVIDVSPMWASGHIPNSISVPLGDGTFDATIPALSRSAEHIIYCHTDEASMAAAQKLADHGFRKVYRLSGNFSAWQGAGYTVATPKYTDQNASDANTALNSTIPPTVIDVSPMYTAGHLPGAFSFPLGDGTLEAVIPRLDKNAEYLVYCHSDEASMAGAQALVNANFAKVKRLEGNYGGWTELGLTTVESPSDYRDVTPAAAKHMTETNNDLIIIDVSPMFNNGHLPGAVNYPLGDGSLDTALSELDKTSTYLIYCHSNDASMSGAKKLADNGFESVFRLQGNYGAWVDAGYETVMETSVEHKAPATFSVNAPFPNPFNPVTTIGFTIPEAANVNLIVYDVLGRKITELINNSMTAGTYNTRWDGRDDKGNLTASGIYFYRMTAGPHTAQGKMTFLR